MKSDDLSERITNDLKKWDSITDHRTGSKGDNDTAEWLAEEIRAVGLKPNLDRFEFQRRVLKECSVVVGETRIVGVPLFDGGVTGREPIRARLGQPCDAGTIALTHYTTKTGDKATTEMMAARKRTDNLAIVAIGAKNAIAPGIAVLNAEAYSHPYGLPVLQVADEHAKTLETALKSGQEVSFTAHIELKTSSTANVQVTIPGKHRELKQLVIMTPRSAWWTCTSERAGGITVWLECIRHFAATRPERDVIFTANTGHELSHLGFEHFLRQHKSLIKEAHAWIHLGANFATRDGRVVLQASNDKFMALLREQLRTLGDEDLVIVPIGQRPLGEARNVFDGGGQFVSILGSNPLFHHPYDRWPHAVDLKRTEDLTRGLLQVAKQFAEK